MEFVELAKMVANAIMREDVLENGYETYKEMVSSQMLESDDIREMICARVKQCGGDCWDDMTMIQNSSSIFADDMRYGNFKKLVMRFVKEGGNSVHS